MTNNTKTFRTDISALRALAVLSVLFFHFNIIGFKGGFIGVDIFFVISGYLMSKIILTGFSLNNFQLLNFYKKRTLRIFPALIAMIVLFSIIIAIVLPTKFFSFQNDAFPSVLFFSNISFYLNSGYFDPSAAYNFLLHTWSLSVEWQFYLLYPILLLCVKKVFIQRRNLFFIIFWICILASLLGMVYFNAKDDNSFSFYMFPSRAWEMMLGGAAFLYQDKWKNVSLHFKKIIVLFSFAIIGAFIVSVNGYTVSWPSLLTIIPTLCTALIININVEFGFFKNKYIKYIGDISYSLYLYHWPIFVITHFLSLDIRIYDRLFFIAVSFILAVLSYEFIEKSKWAKRFGIVATLSISLFLVCIALAKINKNLGFPPIIESGKYLSNYKYSPEAVKQYHMRQYHLVGDEPLPHDYQTRFNFPNNNKKGILLLGDSHAGMFGRTIREIAEELDVNFMQISSDATFPIWNEEGKYETPKKLFNFVYGSYLKKEKEHIDLVIIKSSYFRYNDSLLNQKLDSLLLFFKHLDVPLMFIGQTPYTRFEYLTSNYLEDTYSVIHLENKNRLVQLKNKNIFLKEKLGNLYVDLLSQEVIPISPEGIPYIYDTNHLTYFGTQQHKAEITKHIKKYLKE